MRGCFAANDSFVSLNVFVEVHFLQPFDVDRSSQQFQQLKRSAKPNFINISYCNKHWNMCTATCFNSFMLTLPLLKLQINGDTFKTIIIYSNSHLICKGENTTPLEEQESQHDCVLSLLRSATEKRRKVLQSNQTSILERKSLYKSFAYLTTSCLRFIFKYNTAGYLR